VEDLKEYLAGSHGDDCLILQRYIAHEGEAGVFYIRHPDETRGRIASMAFTYAPHVTGDGRSSVAALVGAHPVLKPERRDLPRTQPQRTGTACPQARWCRCRAPAALGWGPSTAMARRM
jgi:hypothetical protein